MSKTAVILFNLGGPDRPAAVKPFLFNLFNDKAIIGLPSPARWLLAKFIAWRRSPIAQKIYAQIGGRSPILEETEGQADALQGALGSGDRYRVFIVMRYWHPRAVEVVKKIANYAPDKIVLLPLYPQFSTTTTASSIKDWQQAAENAGLTTPTYAICCYPTDAGWVNGQANLLRQALANYSDQTNYRVLFSAHGLPEKTIATGDPYQWQVEQSAKALALTAGLKSSAWLVCYQSRVGPLKWIRPSLDEALEKAAAAGEDVIVVPIAFVSEHSETLVELDREYAARAAELGINTYRRVPALGSMPDFIEGLANLVRSAEISERTIGPDRGKRRCSASWSGCPC